MMGVGPSSFAKEMEGLGISAIGINCGKSLDDNYIILNELSNATDIPIWFKPNAGLPHLDKSGQAAYDITPEQMAKNIPNWINAGARIIGGCCGTTPEHLKAMANIINTIGLQKSSNSTPISTKTSDNYFFILLHFIRFFYTFFGASTGL